MQTVAQYRLTKLAEECNEVAQRALKQAVHGRDQRQSSLHDSNKSRTREELMDLMICLRLCMWISEVDPIEDYDLSRHYLRKRERAKAAMTESVEAGLVTPSILEPTYFPEYL